jgi:hypothetical protein
VLNSDPQKAQFCRFPGASGLLLDLKLFDILPDGSNSKGQSKAAAAGLITDLNAATPFTRPLTIRDLRVMSMQLSQFNDSVRVLPAVEIA